MSGTALKLAMEGQNESARVSASRVLMDALADPKGDGGCQRCATRDKEAQGAAEEFKRRIMDMAYRHQLQRAVIIDHEFDELRDAAAEHRAEALLVAVADARDELIERFEARRSETSERLREEILHPRREHIFRGGDESVMKA